MASKEIYLPFGVQTERPISSTLSVLSSPASGSRKRVSSWRLPRAFPFSFPCTHRSSHHLCIALLLPDSTSFLSNGLCALSMRGRSAVRRATCLAGRFARKGDKSMHCLFTEVIRPSPSLQSLAFPCFVRHVILCGAKAWMSGISIFL